MGWGRGLYTCSGFVEEEKTQPGQRRACCRETKRWPRGLLSPSQERSSVSALTFTSNPQQRQLCFFIHLAI